jgi:hypothetical protein
MSGDKEEEKDEFWKLWSHLEENIWEDLNLKKNATFVFENPFSIFLLLLFKNRNLLSIRGWSISRSIQIIKLFFWSNQKKLGWGFFYFKKMKKIVVPG